MPVAMVQVPTAAGAAVTFTVPAGAVIVKTRELPDVVAVGYVFVQVTLDPAAPDVPQTPKALAPAGTGPLAL
jgi:hypothetical protein